VDSSSNFSSRKNVSAALLDHLERQKEETSRLLEKSRTKQSAMIAIMPLAYSNAQSNYSSSSYPSKI
jgi:hypothetical protein